jgi:hypothetical protein
MALYTATITNAGRTLIANAQAGSGTIYPVNIHTGDGLLVQGDDPLTLPALKHEVQDYSLEGSNALTAYQATFQFLIDSSTVTTSYALNEIGLYCKLGTAGTPTLVYYAYVPGGGGDVVIPSGTSNATIDTNYLTITFSNATTCFATLTPAIPPALHAKTHMDYTDGSSPDPIPVATAGHVGLVPHTPADLTQVLIGGDPAAFGPVPLATLTKVGAIRALNGSIKYYLAGDGTWQPIVPLITNNTTLYVDPSYNNVTPNFSSISNAMDYLGGFSIANGISVSILVNDTVYPTSALLNIQHINGQQISIVAANAAGDITFSGVGTITGSAYNWSVQLTGVSSVANIHANTTYLNIWLTSGTEGGFLLTGCYKVTAVSGTTVTIKVPYSGSSFPTLTGTNGYASPLNVILNMSQNQSVTIGNHGVALMRQICIACAQPPSTAIGFNALTVAGPGFLDRVGVNGFIPSAGFTANGQYIGILLAYQAGTAFKCCATGNMHGFICEGNGSWTMIWCAGSNNTSRGFWAQGGQFVGCFDYVTPGGSATSFACGNGESGLLITSGSLLVGQGGWENGVFVFGSWISHFNAAWGCKVGEKSVTTSSQNSDLSGNNGSYISGLNNGSGDLAISGISVCDLQVIGSRIFSQATGVFNANGVINV